MALFGQTGRTSLLPPVVKVLLIANVSVYILQHFLLAGFGGNLYHYFVGYLALWPIDTSFQAMIGFKAGTFLPHQILTYQFMHGDFWHLFFNMFMLWMFGNTLERHWGSRRFLSVYILSGIGAAILHLGIMYAMGEFAHPTVGASGSLYGILIGFAMMFPEERLIVFPIFIPIKAKYVILGAMAIEMFSGIMRSSDGIAHFAHIGGALTAFLLIKFAFQSGFLSWLDKIWPLQKVGVGNQNYGNTYDAFNQRRNQNPFVNTREKQESKTYNYSWFTGQNKDNTSSTSYSEPKTRTTTQKKSYVVNGEEINQAKIDEILDKINASGYQNLTDREKKILTELSKKL